MPANRLVAVLLSCCFLSVANGDVLAALRVNRTGGLPLMLNYSTDSLSNSELAKKFAKDPLSWRNVAEDVYLIGWYTKEKKVPNEDRALSDALSKFYNVLGLVYEPNAKKVRKGPVYTVIQKEKKMVFTVGEAIGKGAYGEVRIAEETTTHELYAMKTEFKHIAEKEKVLSAEYSCYQELSQHGLNSSIPYIVPNSTGVWQKRDAMIMELLGTNLDELFNICGKQFSLKTLLTILLQLSESLRKIHALGYLHRDIKPENCMIGNILGHNGPENSKIIKLTDFGFGTKMKDANGKPIPLIFEQAGTETYMSRDVYAKIPPRPKDDIETLSYVMLYLWLGYMPFVVAEDKDESETDLCKGCPKQLIDYLTDARRDMKASEEPNYDGHKALFEELIKLKGIVLDKQFDWEYRLFTLLKDPEVNKVGVACEKVKTEDGTFWISVFLVGKFYVDVLHDMQLKRTGLQKLFIDPETTEVARRVAKNLDMLSTDLGVKFSDVMVVKTKTTEKNDLLGALAAKYPENLGEKSFIGMVTNPRNFYVGFGCSHNATISEYTFVVILSPELIQGDNMEVLSINKKFMEIAQKRVKNSSRELDEKSCVTKVLEVDLPLETTPLRDAVSKELSKCYNAWRQPLSRDISSSNDTVGYAYDINNAKNKLIVAVTVPSRQEVIINDGTTTRTLAAEAAIMGHLVEGTSNLDEEIPKEPVFTSRLVGL